MKKLSTIRTAQAAGRRRGGVFTRPYGTNFRLSFGADGPVLVLASFRGLRIEGKSAVSLQLTVQGRRAW